MADQPAATEARPSRLVAGQEERGGGHRDRIGPARGAPCQRPLPSPLRRAVAHKPASVSISTDSAGRPFQIVGSDAGRLPRAAAVRGETCGLRPERNARGISTGAERGGTWATAADLCLSARVARLCLPTKGAVRLSAVSWSACLSVSVCEKDVFFAVECLTSCVNHSLKFVKGNCSPSEKSYFVLVLNRILA